MEDTAKRACSVRRAMHSGAHVPASYAAARGAFTLRLTVYRPRSWWRFLTSGRSYFQDRHSTLRGASVRAMRINRHCKKNHSQSRQELVRSPRCMFRVLFVAIDATEVKALEIILANIVERASLSIVLPIFEHWRVISALVNQECANSSR